MFPVDNTEGKMNSHDWLYGVVKDLGSYIEENELQGDLADAIIAASKVPQSHFPVTHSKQNQVLETTEWTKH